MRLGNVHTIRNNFQEESTCQTMLTRTIKNVVSAIAMALLSHPLALPELRAMPGTSVSDDISQGRQNAITRAVAKCSSAVVGINVTEIREQVYRDPFADDPFFQQFLRRREYVQRYKVHGVGSGFIISKDGFVLTNDHVAGKASKVVITMTDGKKFDAKVVGSDAVSDVALLKIDGANLPYLELANSEDVIVGEWTIAFGNPFGLFDYNAKPTVTVGVVSNTGVNFTQPDYSGEERVYKGMIQTDAAISSGNSGGPLVNAVGEVIGINTVIYSTAQSASGAGSIGIGFAIPINRVNSIVKRLKEDGKIDRNFWTGMRLQEITQEIAEYYDLKQAEGILVTRIAGNSPADKAGLEPGDIIIAINGEQVVNNNDLNLAILDGVVGQKITMTILRNKETMKLTMTLEKAPGGMRD